MIGSSQGPRRHWTKYAAALGVFLLLFVPLPSVSGEESSDAAPLRVALIQASVAETDYVDHQRFGSAMESLVRNAVDGRDADFIVFPEYINVFALFDDFSREIAAADTVNDLSETIEDAGGIPTLVQSEAIDDTAMLRSMWAGLARRYEVWILAGTAFVPAKTAAAEALPEVTNQAWLFSPDGTLIYRQDKVFLTPYEADQLDLAAGTVARARPFIVEDVTFGLTICRDSYFDHWEERFSTVDVWLDIRANGERWSPAVRRRFNTAMPERVAETPVEIGVSTSLNGAFLEHVWQGPAYVVDRSGRRVVESPVIDGDHVTVVTIPR